MRSAFRFFAKALVGIGGLVSVLKGVVWLLNQVGLFQTVTELLENRSLIVKWLLTISQGWPLGVFAIGVFVLACIHVGSPKSWISKICVRQPEQQEVFIAIDELKRLLTDGMAMEAFLEIPERKTKPDFWSVRDWFARVNRCARQKALAGIVGPKELRKLNTDWPAEDVQSPLEAAGNLEELDDEDRRTFCTLQGHVNRLQELIAVIEGAPGTGEFASDRREGEPSVQVRSEPQPAAPVSSRDVSAVTTEIRSSICRKINELIKGGDELLSRLQIYGGYNGVEGQFNKWSERCDEYLGDSLGATAVKLFHSPTAGLLFNPMKMSSTMLGDPWNRQGHLYDRISSRTTRLREIVRMIERGEIEPC
jgi:hypothetical protein